MKLLSVLAVGVAGYASLNDINIDPKDPMGGLSMMMATAQRSLGRAQRHHQKVVDKMRKRVESNFNTEADSVGGVIAEFSENLTVADMRLQAAINASMAGLKKEEAVPSKLDDWMDPGVAERARLNAEINSAQRILQHSLLAHQRAVTEAEDTAGQAFEDQSMRLGMKLGDLTEQSESAKKEMQALVDKKGEAGTVQAKSSSVSGKDQQARLKQYEAILTKAQKESQATAAATQKRFTQFLSKATNVVGQESDKVLSDLEAAQQQEIEKVLGKKKTTQKVAQRTHDAKASAIHKYAMTHHGHLPPTTTTRTTTTTTSTHRAPHKKMTKPKQVLKTTTHTTTTLSPAQKASAHKNHKKHTK